MIAQSQVTAIRLGFGLSPRAPLLASPRDILISLNSVGTTVGAIQMDQVRKFQIHRQDLKRLTKDQDSQRQKIEVFYSKVRRVLTSATLRHFAQAVDTPTGFEERLVQFWSDHFTVSGGDGFERLMAAAFVDEAIRPHIGSHFADLMFAAETHPRMLTYLDQTRSSGPNSAFAKKRPAGLNENLAREMIELHSLGVGADYTQRDVRQLAKLLTGLTYDPRQETIFRPNRAEPGAEVILGERYGGKGRAKLDDIRAAIDALASHPATARHIARKLAVHFVSDDPPRALLDRLAEAYGPDGDLRAVYAVLVEAPELEIHFRQKLRQPFDFIVAALRGLGVSGEQVMALSPKQMNNWLLSPMKAMGQNWGNPPGPDGWPEAAENWATPQGLAARIDWAMRVPSLLIPELPDPRDLLTTTLGETSSEPLRWAVPKAESAQEGVALILASADFNRR
jgi:uncharacterized protein (DUF1800 family)